MDLKQKQRLEQMNNRWTQIIKDKAVNRAKLENKDHVSQRGKMESKIQRAIKRQLGKLFKSDELMKLYQVGQMDTLFQKLGHIINPTNLIATANDTSVFRYDKDGKKYVVKVTPKNLRFFKHFGHDHSAKDFKKYINRLDPYFLPVDEILYEDENIFVYSQEKCTVIKTDKINRKVVAEVLRLVQFMLVNDILLTDLAPHNLGLIHHHVVVFDYHGLHRLTQDGSIKRVNWWRRLLRNLTRFISALHGAHKRAEYSALMQNCTDSVVKQIEEDQAIPKPYSQLVRYLFTEQNRASIPQICEYLENTINEILLHK